MEPITVLMVEDDPDDVYLTEDALRTTRLRMNLHVVNDGVEAMQFLRREDGYAGSPRPDLVLLDLNLPRMDGREVLSAIRSDPAFTGLPVVVLTTSKAEQDVMSSYQQHANCYISKPVDIEQFRAVVASIESFWFTVVQLPPGSHSG
ncbi:MAG TPA: response regulator [Rugosimonospora sp.]|nr:response regulator [Rugosimonospora sp.]